MAVNKSARKYVAIMLERFPQGGCEFILYIYGFFKNNVQFSYFALLLSC